MTAHGAFLFRGSYIVADESASLDAIAPVVWRVFAVSHGDA